MMMHFKQQTITFGHFVYSYRLVTKIEGDIFQMNILLVSDSTGRGLSLPTSWQCLVRPGARIQDLGQAALDHLAMSGQRPQTIIIIMGGVCDLTSLLAKKKEDQLT